MVVMAVFVCVSVLDVQQLQVWHSLRSQYVPLHNNDRTYALYRLHEMRVVTTSSAILLKKFSGPFLKLPIYTAKCSLQRREGLRSGLEVAWNRLRLKLQWIEAGCKFFRLEIHSCWKLTCVQVRMGWVQVNHKSWVHVEFRLNGTQNEWIQREVNFPVLIPK